MRSEMNFDPERVKAFVEGGFWRDDTIRKYIARNAASAPDSPAVIDASGSVSNIQLEENVVRVASALYHLGVCPGDVVAVQAPNSLQHLESFLAICWLGAVMTPLYMTFRESELTTQLNHSRAKAMIVPRRIGAFSPSEWALANKHSLPHLQEIIVIGDRVEGTHNHAELARSTRAPPSNLPEPTAADPFLLLYTSGTTSAPKGVLLSSQLLLTNARVGTEEHNINAGDIVLSGAPFGHIYALYTVQMAICAGASVLLLPRFTPTDMINVIENQRPTHIFAGPAHIAACRAAGLWDKADLSSVRLLVLSGAAVPPELVRAASPYLINGEISQLWGMTECQAVLYSRPGDPIDLAAQSAGRVAPGDEVRIVDGNTDHVAVGEEGELQIRGATVFTGYYENPEATAKSFTEDGWFRTGDLARMDAAGNVAITGRSKDVINRGGVKYNPQEIECLIEGHPAVIQCAIAPVPDERLGEKACCYAMLSPGATITLEEICAYLDAKGIAKYKFPEYLEIRESLPLTATRKVIKGKL